MRASSLRRLVRLNLSRARRSTVASVFGVGVGVAALVFFVALGLGVGRVVREKVFPVDARLVEVVPSQLSFGLLGGRLDEATVTRLGALPGVRAAWRKMSVRVPAVSFYDGDFFGRRLRMGIEVLAVGVDPGLVRADVQLGAFEDPAAGEAIPAVASTRLIEIYNTSFAASRGLPQLSAAMLTGFTFPVDWNRSFVAEVKPGQVVRGQAQVVGVSDRGLLAGILVPLDTARRLNAAAGVDAVTYSGVALEAEDPARVPALVAAVKDMGLQVDDQERRLSENVGAAVAITTSAMALLSLLICLLAAFNIAHALSASVRARERELGVMRAVGASRRDIFQLVMAEAVVQGLAGGLGGTALAAAAAFGVDALAARVLPEFPFKPESFFVLPAWLCAGGVLLGVLAAVGGALWPARRASAVDPARVLAGQVS